MKQTCLIDNHNYFLRLHKIHFKSGYLFPGVLLIVFFLCFTFLLQAQQNEYPTKTVNGVEYYIYQVKSSEGLYSISKKFGVSQAEINNANPQIQEGLKAGQEILIPKKNSNNQIIVHSAPANDSNYVLHTVKKKQTLFAISRQYNVSQEAIVQANPQIAERGIQTNEILRIPLKASSNSVSNPTQPTKIKPEKEINQKISPIDNFFQSETGMRYFLYKVQKKETLYSLSKKYNVSIEDMIALNPEISGKLKAGNVIKMPDISAANSSKIVVKPKPIINKSSYKVAYLLPFMLHNNTFNPTVYKFIEFYMGSLLAINNAKNSDMKFEIYTYDIEKSESKVYEVLNKPEMQQMDFIFGPAYTTQIPIVADFAKRHKIYTAVPFSSNVDDLNSNPYIFQFNPDQDIQNEYVENLIKNRFKESRLIFVETSNSEWTDGMEFFNYLMKRLDRQHIIYTKIKDTDLLKDETYLNPTKRNLIIFNTDQLKSVQNSLNKLYDLGSKYDLTVLGQYSWRDEKGKKPRMCYVSPFSGNKSATDFYEQEYKKYYGKYRTETNPCYDMLGYDLTTYFLSSMKKTGFLFDNSTSSLVFSNGVQSNFDFKRVGKNGGFVNHQMYLIENEPKSK